MDDATRREIDKVAWRTLRDAGLKQPPVSLNVLLEHLELFRGFYDLQNPGFLDKAKHKIRVHGRKLIRILDKIRLRAVLFYEEHRIVVDETLPEIKREWPSFHEAAHKILVWHEPYFSYGDTAETLDPHWREPLEAEANYAASALMFCGPVFGKEARDTKPEWAAVEELKKRYGKSYSTTLRRYVEFGPQVPMALLVSTLPWADQPSDQDTRSRHFVVSPSFGHMFSNITQEHLRRRVDASSPRRHGGLVLDVTLHLRDDNGSNHEFRAQSFNNSYYLQTLFVYVAEITSKRIILPGNGRYTRTARGG